MYICIAYIDVVNGIEGACVLRLKWACSHMQLINGERVSEFIFIATFLGLCERVLFAIIIFFIFYLFFLMADFAANKHGIMRNLVLAIIL